MYGHTYVLSGGRRPNVNSMPVADNADPGGRALNRRVELELR
ncbi:MAG TPA: hypothetical protein PL010_06445 [Flavobacteriales bacterium]|nr:hypothetical protein [Flavobacteriales bacterium]HMZ49409.1 hypothetical protein [Flavobacteriales bacterium]HNE80303.1 hypothetical protein [Flavobacteriales bacterium]HNI04255.1 hypothetical protein [Flavobacteriales bacterium]HNK40140.1 hypothetical protein [Flavobacteriales bacterium]